MPRDRLYASNAERQAAYRARLAHRQQLAGIDPAAGRLQQLERDLAAAQRRAVTAEARTARAEQRWQAAEAGWAAAKRQLGTLKATVDDLTRRLTAIQAQPPRRLAPTTSDSRNRADRRRADRDRKRGR